MREVRSINGSHLRVNRVFEQEGKRKKRTAGGLGQREALGCFHHGSHMLVTMYALAADAVLLLHLGFVLFVGLGGLLALRWPRIAWIHIPAAIWGAAIEFGGWICPLTPIENDLRLRAGESPYTGDFVARYLLPVIYPEGLTRDAQIILGVGVVIVNAVVYAIVYRRLRARSSVG